MMPAIDHDADDDDDDDDGDDNTKDCVVARSMGWEIIYLV